MCPGLLDALTAGSLKTRATATLRDTAKQVTL